MRHAYRCHLAPDAVRDGSAPESNGERARLDPSEIVGDARCPCCRTPLVARMGRHGPYFYCRCHERKESDARRE
jgi:hypothetical protein